MPGQVIRSEVAHRQQLVVHAQPVPLCVSIGQHTGLQHRVIADSNSCTSQGNPRQHAPIYALQRSLVPTPSGALTKHNCRGNAAHRAQ